jgi:hypothetical protein
MTPRQPKKNLRTLAVCGFITMALLVLYASLAAACSGGGGSECRKEPTVTVESAKEIQAHLAVFHATINPQGCETSYEFEYAVAGSKLFVNVGGGILPGAIVGEPVSVHVSGLAAHTTYEVRAKAHNEKGPGEGGPVSFTTLFDPPSVTTKAASEVKKTTAVLNGTINTHESATTYHFEYGLKKGEYVSVSSGGSLGAGTENVSVKDEIKSLEPGTTYHFRLMATNSGGTTYGADEALTTSSLSWTTQTTPSPAGAKSSRLTFGSCTTASACTSVGEYLNSGGTKVPLAERWNGTSWSAESPPTTEGAAASELLGVSCTSGTACEAAGFYESGGVRHALAEVWNGTSWSVQTTANPTGAISAELTSISCTSNTACTAVGHYTTSTSSVTLAERWNGTSWVVQSTANPSGATESSLLATSCASSTACTASGYYYNSEGQRRTLAESWNGTEWSIKTTPNRTGATLNILLGVSCSASNACTAVGGDFPSGGGPQETLVERWNGTEWSIQTSQNPGGSEASVLHGISCPSATACMATGDYVKAAVNVTLAERWNGSEWSLQSTPNPSGATFSALWSVTCPSVIECVAPGYYKNESGTELALTQKGS